MIEARLRKDWNYPLLGFACGGVFGIVLGGEISQRYFSISPFWSLLVFTLVLFASAIFGMAVGSLFQRKAA